jgi:cell division protein FtsB
MNEKEKNIELENLKQKVNDQKTIISNLNKENRDFQNTINKLKTENSEMKNKFDDQIRKLKEKISDLEKTNVESPEIDKYKSQVKKNKFTILKLNRKVDSLKERNQKLEKEVEQLMDEITSTDTLISPKTVIRSSKKQRRAMEVPTELESEKGLINDEMVEEDITEDQLIETEFVEDELEEKPRVGEVEREETVITKGKVQAMINKRNEAIKSTERTQEDSKISERSQETNEPILDTIEQEIEEKSSGQVSEVQKKENVIPKEEEFFGTQEEIDHHISEEKKPSTEPGGKEKVIVTEEGKRECPRCGNSNKRTIRELIDRTKIISAYPKMYGTKFKCGECGAEWR